MVGRRKLGASGVVGPAVKDTAYGWHDGKDLMHGQRRAEAEDAQKMSEEVDDTRARQQRVGDDSGANGVIAWSLTGPAAKQR
ncbi:hypothetical protein R1sor_013227 [Riccia sorocarpa]|uniref:Uncharacterized protein n=1 Tax=Riccia sorocarpa TaxID=122646 RepID=A0ABD3H6I1_9MARC